MIYKQVLEKFGTKKEVHAAIIGAGHFGKAVVTQQTYVKGLTINFVADKKKELAKNAFLEAKIPEENIVYAQTAIEAEKALQQKKFVYSDHAEIAAEIPSIDIICEGTGVPEASARFCKSAIEHGKHIAIISKEMDSVIGPVLKKMAKKKGLVYTPVDGDQHGLLMQMVEWARLIGLTVISAGKSRDGEFVYDEASQTVSIAADEVTISEGSSVKIPHSEIKYFSMIPEGKAQEYLDHRQKVLSTLPPAGGFDLCESLIMANATGLKPASAPLTQGTLRITELPIAYCSQKNNGIYDSEGYIDIMTCLRRPDESGMGGGVFLVVRCDNAYSNHILTTKGQIPNYDHSTAVIYRPYHLCGDEISTSLYSAVCLGVDTGSSVYEQKYDMVRQALRDIKAGEVLGNDHDKKMTSLIYPATKRSDDQPVPAHMLDGLTVKKDIKNGEVITYSMIEAPEDSVLWNLRALQEEN